MFKNIFGADLFREKSGKMGSGEGKNLTWREKKEKKDVNLSRRKFLRRSVETAAGAAGLMYLPEGLDVLSAKAIDLIDDFSEDLDELTAEQKKIDDKDDEVFDSVAKEEILEKVKKQIWEDERQRALRLLRGEDGVKSLDDEFSLANERISLDAEKIQDSLRQNWLNYYKTNGHADLVNAYSKMQAYLPEFKNAFKKEGVPEKYLYLAIPESHFDANARSGAGAVGPYQFTIQTAEEVGLAKTTRDASGKILKAVFDNRKDPVKSAEACAKYLRKKFDQCGDWRLAVAAYNGIVGKYFLAEEDKEKRDYNAYVEFVEDDVNQKKESVKKMTYYEYSVESGETLGAVAEEFKIDIALLRKINGIKESDNLIKKSQKLKIKLSSPEQRMIVFEKIANIKGLGENFNYPAKFEAVWQLIEEAESGKNGRNPLLREDVVKKAKLDREKKSYYNYQVKQGDNLYKIASTEIKRKGLKVAPNDLIAIIKKQNNLKTDNIRPKQILKIPQRV